MLSKQFANDDETAATRKSSGIHDLDGSWWFLKGFPCTGLSTRIEMKPGDNMIMAPKGSLKFQVDYLVEMASNDAANQ
jgi:hypothetical protein